MSGLTPDQVLEQSASASKSLTAYRVRAVATGQAQLAEGSASGLIAQILRAPVKIAGEGPVDDDAASFDFDATLSGLPAIQANVTKVGGGLFAGLLGTDYKVDLPAASVAAVRPAELASGLLGWATKPSDAGREAVDGTDTVHLTASVDVGEVLDAASAALGAIQNAPISRAGLEQSRPQLEAALTERVVDLWIGTADLLPRRIKVRLRFSGRVDAISALRSASVDLDMRFSDFGKSVSITAPSTTEVLDLARLRSLAP